MRGKFITFEGGEGTGKSTQAKLLADRLAVLGIGVKLTREPGGSPGAEIIRHVILSGAAKPPRLGLNRSDVRLWAAAGALSRAVSIRHGKAARRKCARLLRPVPGDDPTMEQLQRNQILPRSSPPAGGNHR